MENFVGYFSFLFVVVIEYFYKGVFLGKEFILVFKFVIDETLKLGVWISIYIGLLLLIVYFLFFYYLGFNLGFNLGIIVK